MADEKPEARQCPVCRCTFQPSEHDQRYCSSFCERADRARQA